MFPLTLRETKGSPLTHQEMDNNLKHVMFPPFLHIQDQKPQGTHGGTFTAGTWRTRDLNTVLTNTITGASLAANQITLPAGKYYAEGFATAYHVRQHVAILSAVSGDAKTLLTSNSGFIQTFTHPTQVTVHALFSGCFDLSEESNIEIRHQCDTTHSNGLGVASNFTTEVYSDIRIWRVGEYEE